MASNETRAVAVVSAPEQSPGPLSQDIIRDIAMDIGKEVAAHIEIMYPKAVTATSKNMLLSVRNCVYNQIMAALEVIDEEAIRTRLERRRQHRRMMKASYAKIRDNE